MLVTTLRPSLVVVVVVVAVTVTVFLATPTAATADGGRLFRRDDTAPNTFRTRCEYAPEFQRARMIREHDHAWLYGDAEAVRGTANMQYLSIYNRPMSVWAPPRSMGTR